MFKRARILFAALSAVLPGMAGDFHATPADVGGSISRPAFDFSLVVHGEGWRRCGRISGTAKSRYEPPAEAGRQTFEVAVPEGPVLAGESSLRGTDGALAVRYALETKTPGRVETVSVQGYVRMDEFGGGRVAADGKTRALPSAGEENGVEFGLGTVSDLRVESADGRKSLAFAFAKPVVVSVLRKRGLDRLTLRLSAVRHAALLAGDRHEIAFTLKASEPVMDVNTPWTAAEGPDFVPLAYRADIVKGSALDFTGIVPRHVCGTHGRLRARGGHFEFDGLPGVRQKFFGMNLHSYACYHTMEEARRLTDLFVRCGYNAVRFHNYENEYMGLTKGSPDEATPVPERFEGLDNLVAACRERGLYVTVDLHIGRRVSYRAIGIDKPGMVVNSDGMKGEIKYQYLVNPKARENFKTFVRGFFEHVNPHTGNRYADEPTLALVSVVNESPCCWNRYGGNGWKTDLCKLEYDLMREMSAFIRDEVKSQVPLTTCNGGAMPFCLQPMRDAFCDYVDDHFYYDHPQWPAKTKWTPGDRVPMYTRNRRYVADGLEIPPQALMTRLWGKPYVITEFNWCAPSLYRASAGLVVGAMAGAQDWDGLWRYLWAHDHARALEPGRHPIAKLESASDPLAMAADRAAMCLFLRGDMEPLPRKASVVIPRKSLDVEKPHACVWGRDLAWPTAGWYAQLGTAMDRGPEGSVKDFSYPDDVKISSEKAVSALGMSGRPLADGAVSVDRARNAFCVQTPRTCGGSVEKGAFAAGVLSADCGDQVATIWASSLDGRDLLTSGRILLTHLTRLYNTGDRFADRDGTYLLASGASPYLMPRARAEVSLALADPGVARVYALDSDGSRRGEVPASVRDGRLVFTCDTARDAKQATYLYEIAREAARKE